ncbi:relaxase/mobilization nuclease domain-containing protein [Streptomyces sp. NPDC048282]|uniref:relaxase/mobilization nuclease domain-containing protein n=1 Tax=Streptomyces sp. NPDC048282 TaxID=3365528 RepID=UPI003717B9A2
MIPKIILGKGPHAVRRTIGYLFGKGRANEHIDPHLVASWNDFAPDPGRSPHRDPKKVENQLAAQLDQPVQMLGDKAPRHTVWHCPVRAAPEDPILTDAQWADIAHRIVGAAGIAPEGDEEACRWVAVRHADDHIHIAATLVRQDGRRPRRDHDQRAVQRECRRIEVDYGLRQLKPGDGTAAKRPTSKEHFKAKRLGQVTASRDVLRQRVRRAVAAAADEAEFFALPGDTNDKGEPVFYSGSTLAPDLSLPRIRKRLASTIPEPVRIRPGNPWHQATAAVDRIPRHLTNGDDRTAQGQLVALGAALDLLPATAPAVLKAELEQAAAAFERATRSRIAADLDSARVLRRSVQVIWRDRPQDRDGAGFAMLLDVTLTAVAFAMHWHRTRRHAQQEAAAEQALLHLRGAYALVAEPVLTGLARRSPGLQTKRRFAHHLREAIPEHAERILDDPAWEALATVLAEAEAAGHNAATVIDQALGERALDDARSPARALTWRVRRLGERHAPGPRAEAAKARTGTQRLARPSPPVQPSPQPARRR